ncbi:MAG: LLM class flavin-dependent oxidoreductase [Acidimicrobiales bacterium]
MRLGIMLPTFQDSYSFATDTARRAETCNLDGVFCYDHIWPIGHPGAPAFSCFPLLGAIAASTCRITIGTLVARVSLYAEATQRTDMLVHSFEALHSMASGRVIAGIGSGDSKSTPEDSAYGIESKSAESRRSQLADAARRLTGQGIDTWIGSGSSLRTLLANMALAGSTGASINVWQMDPLKIDLARTSTPIPDAGEASNPPMPETGTRIGDKRASCDTTTGKSVPITWAGSLDLLARAEPEGKANIASYAEALSRLALVGVTWAVCAGIDPDLLAEAARTAGYLQA